MYKKIDNKNFLKLVNNKKDIVIFSRNKGNLELIENFLKNENINNFLIINVPEALKGKEPCNFMVGFLQSNDFLIIYDFSDLGSSFENIYNILNLLINKVGLKEIYCMKYNILFSFYNDNEKNFFLDTLNLIKKTERDIFSYRSKTGINEAKLKGKRIGRPKSEKTLPNPLDKHKRTIKRLLKSGYTIKSIAKKYNVTYRQMSYYIHSRNLI